jgi:hypothetical protein
LNHPLLDLRPGFALTLNEQRKHRNLTVYANAIPVEHLFIAKRPIDLAPTRPLTPASSKASRAADLAGRKPFIGQPFGMIHCLDCRVVTRRISNAASWLNR